MKENLMEILEKHFPNGFLIFYPTDNEIQTRALLSAEKDTPAAKQLSAIRALVRENEEK
jgi:hypothetical protein